MSASQPQRFNRRKFLAAGLSAGTAIAFGGAPAFVRSSEKRARRVLLRSSWQTVNIGDIAHTPGMLTLLERHLPDVDVTLWPSSVDNGVAQMLTTRFPRLRILESGAGAVDEALRTHDFLLHGSGPGMVGHNALKLWKEKTGKPYGIGGITWTYSEPQMELINGARFSFFRDSVSLGVAQKRGGACPLMEFGPDATFACDLVSDEAAGEWLRDAGLEEGKFVCCIPKLRHTPYWEIKKGVAFSEAKHARNEEMKEHDLTPLRDTVAAVVRETDCKVLLCPEDASQMKLNKEMIFDKLASEVTGRVVWRKDYWLTDFAQSVYNRSAGLFGNEQHSPIMCVGHGIPAVVCRYKEQTSKGFMWKDIGLGDWLLDHDLDEPAHKLKSTVLSLINDPEAAREKTRKAKKFADQRMAFMMESLGKELSA